MNACAKFSILMFVLLAINTSPGFAQEELEKEVAIYRDPVQSEHDSERLRAAIQDLTDSPGMDPAVNAKIKGLFQQLEKEHRVTLENTKKYGGMPTPTEQPKETKTRVALPTAAPRSPWHALLEDNVPAQEKWDRWREENKKHVFTADIGVRCELIGKVDQTSYDFVISPCEAVSGPNDLIDFLNRKIFHGYKLKASALILESTRGRLAELREDLIRRLTSLRKARQDIPTVPDVQALKLFRLSGEALTAADITEDKGPIEVRGQVEITLFDSGAIPSKEMKPITEVDKHVLSYMYNMQTYFKVQQSAIDLVKEFALHDYSENQENGKFSATDAAAVTFGEIVNSVTGPAAMMLFKLFEGQTAAQNPMFLPYVSTLSSATTVNWAASTFRGEFRHKILTTQREVPFETIFVPRARIYLIRVAGYPATDPMSYMCLTHFPTYRTAYSDQMMKDKDVTSHWSISDPKVSEIMKKMIPSKGPIRIEHSSLGGDWLTITAPKLYNQGIWFGQ